MMKVYTIREAARETKIGMEPLKRACEEGVIRATKLTNNQWRIAESALTEALDKGIDFSSLPKKAAKKKPQPPHLRKHQEELKKAKGQAAVTKAPKAPKTTKATKAK
jgi:excisionase family DNA binding protein